MTTVYYKSCFDKAIKIINDITKDDGSFFFSFEMAIEKESFLFWPVLKYLWDVLKICVNNMILSSNVLRR